MLLHLQRKGRKPNNCISTLPPPRGGGAPLRKHGMTNQKDSRYPYTYACDLIRMIAGYSSDGSKLSRSDASHIYQKIAEILGMDAEDLAIKLADYFKENEEKLTNDGVNEFMQVMKWQ